MIFPLAALLIVRRGGTGRPSAAVANVNGILDQLDEHPWRR